jgi:hypothetical protein
MTLHEIHWLLIILSVLDVATTVYALRNRSNVSEGNPIMAAAMGKLGITPALVLLKVVGLGALFYLMPFEGNEEGYWAAVAVMVAIVLNNIYVIRKTRK